VHSQDHMLDPMSHLDVRSLTATESGRRRRHAERDRTIPAFQAAPKLVARSRLLNVSFESMRGVDTLILMPVPADPSAKPVQYNSQLLLASADVVL
jgi:hypothetical protein